MPENFKHGKKERQVHHNYRNSATAFHTSKLFDNIYWGKFTPLTKNSMKQEIVSIAQKELV